MPESMDHDLWRTALPLLPLPALPPSGGWLLSPLSVTNPLKQSLKVASHICQTTKVQRFSASNPPPPGYAPWPSSFTDTCAIPINPDGMTFYQNNPSLIPPSITLITEIPSTPPTVHTSTFADLFSGIGGFRLALSASSTFTCSLSCELRDKCRHIYAQNFAHCNLMDDVTRIPSSVIAALAPTIIAGGFPCQSFASHGIREGFENERTGGLFMHVVRLVAAARPPVVILENVRGLLNHEHGQTMSVVVRSLENLGYDVNVQLMDAQHLLPQVRRRVLIVAFKDKAAHARFKFPPTLPLYRSLRSELEATTEGGFVHLNDKQWGKISATSYYADRPESRVANVDGPAGTLCSRYKTSFAMYSQFVPVEGENPRFLSIRECCRLQGFPEKFVLPEGFGSRNEFYSMIGNAVPVPMICAVGLEVEEALGIEGVDKQAVMLRVLREAARDPDEVERAWQNANSSC